MKTFVEKVISEGKQFAIKNLHKNLNNKSVSQIIRIRKLKNEKSSKFSKKFGAIIFHD